MTQRSGVEAVERLEQPIAPPAGALQRSGPAVEPRGITLLERAARFLTHLHDVDTLLQATLDEAMEELRACRGLICLLDPTSGSLEVRFTGGAGWDKSPDLSTLRVRDEPGGGITGHVAATACPYYAPDVTRDPYYISHWSDVRTELGLPLLDSNGNAVGVLILESTEINAFSPEDQAFAGALAQAAAAALSAAYYREREKALIEVGKELSTIVDLNDLMRKVVRRGASLLRAQDCTLLLVSDDRAYLVLAASDGPLRERVGHASYRLGEGLTGWVAEFGQPVRVRDVREDPRWKGLYVELPPEGMGAFMAVPILGGKGTLGVLRVVRRKRKYIGISQEFTESDQELLQTLASQVGAAIENCQLRDGAIRSERLAAWGEMSARAAHMIGNRVFAIKGSLNELKYLLQECARPCLPAKTASAGVEHAAPPTAEGMEKGSEKETENGRLPEIARLVDRISQGITRLEEILAEFRDFVVATQLQTTPLDLNRLIQETADESFPKNGGVRLNLKLAPDLPPVLADPAKLRRAISELLENSLDFQKNGGAVTIETRLLPASEPRDVAARLPAGSLLVIRVQDQGPGVPEELKSRIFSPFFSTRAKGMGLGLSIVSGIVQAHRGVIREAGAPGKGACFEIYLPVAGSNDEV